MDDTDPVAGAGGAAPAADPVAERVQAQHAAERQVAEQRQAAELLADLRRSTGELVERLDAVGQRLDGPGQLGEQVQQLAARVEVIDVPSATAVATAVSAQVGDRIVDALAPRVADVVLSRLAAVPVDQLATSVANSVQYGLGENVRAATVESERRIVAHVDEAVLALAEALLRRRTPGRGAPAGPPVAADLPAVAPPSAGHRAGAAGEPVVPGVADLRAVPSVGLDPTDAQAEAELEGRDVLAQDAGAAEHDDGEGLPDAERTAVGAANAAADADAGGGRRRPWWRPIG